MLVCCLLAGGQVTGIIARGQATKSGLFEGAKDINVNDVFGHPSANQWEKREEATKVGNQ